MSKKKEKSNWSIAGWAFLSKSRNVLIQTLDKQMYLINRTAVSILLRSSSNISILRLENGKWVECGEVSLFEDRNIRIKLVNDDHLYMMKTKMLTGLFMGKSKSKRIPVFALKV